MHFVPRGSLVLLSLLAIAGCDGEALDGGVLTRDAAGLDAAGVDAAGVDAAGVDAGADAGSTGLRPPSTLEATAARGAVGLSWDEALGAESYTVYWSTSPGVSPATGTALTGVASGAVHGGLTDGVIYHYVVTASAGGVESAPSAEASATPGGEFELVQLGGGSIDSLASTGEVYVPIARRVHVLLLSEGYLAGELELFRSDVDDWLSELFAIDPYTTFAPAFVVWALPRASLEHVAAADPQSADTAFLVPITSDGGGVSSTVPRTGPTSARVWEVVEAFPFRPTRFYPAGGRTSRQALGLVVHLLVLDADRGRSGLSGRARRLENPANDAEVISAAIAHNRPHELSHAFARLADEYLDDGHSNNGADVARAGESAYVSNVVDDDACATLPWAHLLSGGAINPDVDELVGAFGNPASGYHSELRCLMNGTHDNAATYGGDGRLRASDRLCNFCRELVALRTFERVGALEPATSMSDWARDHRGRFYARYGLAVPAPLPQESSDGVAWFTPCAP